MRPPSKERRIVKLMELGESLAIVSRWSAPATTTPESSVMSEGMR